MPCGCCRRRDSEIPDEDSGVRENDGSCGRYVRSVMTFVLSHIGLVSLVVGYCLLGAAAFSRLESKHEKEVKEDVAKKRENVTAQLWLMTNKIDVLKEENWTEDAMKHLMYFETLLLTALTKEGWDGSEDDEHLQWTFAGALFYSIVVITTIGYGHIAPKTPWGKVVTIFYAILGIPLMLLCLSNIGDAMAHSFRFMYWKVCCYFCTRRPRRHHRSRGTRMIAPGPPTGPPGISGSRSRTASFRRSQRHSERSADSAISRSSYTASDPECRYEDGEGYWPGDLGMGEPSLKHSMKRTTIRASDPTLSSSAAEAAVMSPPLQPPLLLSQLPRAHSGNSKGNTDPSKVPVIPNKYVLDHEDIGFKAESAAPHHQQQQQAPQQQQHPHQHHPHQHPHQQPGSAPGSLAYRHSYPRRGKRKVGRRPVGGSYPESLSLTVPASAPQTPMANRYQPGQFPPSREFFDYTSTYDFDEEDEDVDTDEEIERTRHVPIWLCVFLVVSYILGGAWLFSGWEGWSFLDSAYFCFITLTTIGFGDYVPAQQRDKLKNIEVSIALCSLYLLFGIALLAMSFNLVQEEVIASVKGVATRLGILKPAEEDDD